jgi:hypothetical protein
VNLLQFLASRKQQHITQHYMQQAAQHSSCAATVAAIAAAAAERLQCLPAATHQGPCFSPYKIPTALSLLLLLPLLLLWLSTHTPTGTQGC